MNSSFEKRKWRCPECQQISLIPEFEDDPILCSGCADLAELDRSLQEIILSSPPSRVTRSPVSSDRKTTNRQVSSGSNSESFTRIGLACGGILASLIAFNALKSFLNPQNPKTGSPSNTSAAHSSVADDHEWTLKSETSTQTTESAPIRFVSGDMVWVQHGTFVALSWDILKQLSKLAHAKDDIGITQLWLNGSAFMVDDGPVQARVLDRGILASEIRITAGRYYGRSGWVYNEQLTMGSDLMRNSSRKPNPIRFIEANLVKSGH